MVVGGSGDLVLGTTALGSPRTRRPRPRSQPWPLHPSGEETGPDGPLGSRWPSGAVMLGLWLESQVRHRHVTGLRENPRDVAGPD